MHVPPRVIRPQGAPTEWVAKATLPTRHGNFETYVFRGPERSLDPMHGAGTEQDPADRSHSSTDHALSPEHVALVFGDVAELRGRDDLLVRVHSECMTSEVFGSLKCDCKEQLEASMAAVSRAGLGAILYLRQEGRGIGLTNKIRAYALQSHGHDTVDANRLLGLPDDARSYEVARDMLAHFGVTGVRLLTNNPAKVTALRKLGVHVVGRVPIVVAANPHSSRYLEAKRLRMEHDLPEHELLAASGDAE
jgi:GTP cyclohydrolase II